MFLLVVVSVSLGLAYFAVIGLMQR